MNEPNVPSRGGFPVEFSLLDDDNQAVLAVDEGVGSTNALVLHVTNRSLHDLVWDVATDGKPPKEFHHLQLTFRPGVLSDATRNKLAKPDTAQQLLRKHDAERWKIGGEVHDDGSQALFLVFEPKDKPKDPLKLPRGNSLQVQFQGISASKATPHGLTKVEVRADKAKLGSHDLHTHATRRHCHLSVLPGGWRPLPVRIGFKGNAIVRADGQPDTVTVAIYNPPKTDAFGAWSGTNPAQFLLSFDHDGPWALKLSPRVTVDGKEVSNVSNDPSHGLGDNPYIWLIKLPESGIAPGKQLEIKIEGLKASSEGTINLHLETYDISGFGRTRVTLPITASLMSARVLHSVVASLWREIALLEPSDSISIPDTLAEAGLGSVDSVLKDRPMGPWSPHFQFLTPLSQKWNQVKDPSGNFVTGVDVSRRFVLIDSNGTVCPVAGGVLGQSLPLPDSSLRPFFEIGEWRGSPLILSQKHEFCWWSPLDGVWVRQSYGTLVHVGEGWLAVGDSNQHQLHCLEKYEKGRGFTSGNFDPDNTLAVRAIGGSERYPLVVDTGGRVWRHKRNKLSRPPWWEQTSLGGAVETLADINSGGVVIRERDERILRYSMSGPLPDWHDTTGGGTRIGGTWRNPMVIGFEKRLYRLEDPK